MGLSVKGVEKAVGGILGTIAPVLASALPGPLGAIAKKAISDLLGQSVSSHEEIEKILATASPETLLKLKELDIQFATQMKQLDVDFQKIAAGDRADARSMQVATRSWVPTILVFVIAAAFFASLAALVFVKIPPENKDIVVQALGQLSVAFIMVVSFWVGTTHQSGAKDDTIQKLSQ